MFLSRHAAWIPLLAALWLIAIPGNASESFDSILQTAEKERSSNHRKFLELLDSLNAVRDNASPEQQEHLDYLNAYALVFRGRFQQAVSDAHRLMSATKDPNTQFRAGSLIVNAYALDRQFTEGLRLLDKTLELADKVTVKEYLHQGLGVAALMNSQIGQPKQALHYADRILNDSPDPRTACLATQVRLDALHSLRSLPEDDEPLHQGIKQCKQQGEIAAANLIRITLAKKWAERGDRKLAIDFLRKHLAEAESTRYPRLTTEMNAFLSEWLLEEGDPDAAKQLALATIALNGSTNATLPMVMAYKTLYEVAEINGDKSAALTAYRNYAETDKAYLNEVKARELAYQIVRQETLQKNQQISLLDQKNQLLQLQSQLDQKSAQNTRLIATLLIVLLASLCFWAYKTKRMQLSLKRMAETDALTGICNRHHFTLRAETVLAECSRQGTDAALIMFDLDDFKQINDRFGHDTGDWALKQVAEACRPLCRRVDVFGRLGGEEFAILVHGCDLEGAARLAENCRIRLAQIDSRDTGHVFPITASFGVASSALFGYSLAGLLRTADKALYRGKHLGRNRVCICEPDQAQPLPHNVLELPQREGRVGNA